MQKLTVYQDQLLCLYMQLTTDDGTDGKRTVNDAMATHMPDRVAGDQHVLHRARQQKQTCDLIVSDTHWMLLRMYEDITASALSAAWLSNSCWV